MLPQEESLAYYHEYALGQFHWLAVYTLILLGKCRWEEK